MKYTGITIGPIIKVLSLARKPRELWSASYLFSELMENLITEIRKEAIIISPGIIKENIAEVGLYPDRLFCKDYKKGFDAIVEIINTTKIDYANKTKVFVDYFKTYAVEINAENDGQAIGLLNKQLDYLELYNIAVSDKAEQSVRKLIESKDNELGSGQIKVETLSEIASAQLEQINDKQYNECLAKTRKEEDETGKETFIKELKDYFKDKFKTPHKYICIVNADGDNMGTIVNTLNERKLEEFSDKLLDFGQKACRSVKSFGGLPIYAGGDDLLFIAPVISNDKNGNEQTIFDLINKINNDFETAEIHKITGKDPETEEILNPSMSYGISITYYKYPLYEALEMSRNLLFGVAKELRKNRFEEGIKIKHAIAWTLQKGSGSSVSGVFSKEEKELSLAFEGLIKSVNATTDLNLVSAVAYKIKSNEALLKLILEDKNRNVRLDAFFETILEYNSKKETEKKYIDAVKKLLLESYNITSDIKETVKTIYAMLRTAKFIKGLEEDKDE